MGCDAILGWLSKKLHMRGTQNLRNEAYKEYAAVTKVVGERPELREEVLLGCEADEKFLLSHQAFYFGDHHTSLRTLIKSGQTSQ